MKSYCEQFKDKRITLMGLGVLGRGINVAKFLLECGAFLTITDLKTKEQLADSIDELKEWDHVEYVLGEHRLEDFENKDMIVKAAGVPLDSPYIAHAREKGVLIEMDASLFAQLVGREVTVIGITGTKGKSTVTQMIYQLLKEAGKNTWLGGNVRGHATLPLLKEIKKGDYVVLELDSWQLQGFGDAQISPHIAVFTNFMPDHLNYYKGNMQTYFDDKANIFKYQKKNDYLVVSTSAFEAIQKYYKDDIKSKPAVAKPFFIPHNWNLKVPGEHNRENAALVLQVGEIIGIERGIIQRSLEEFQGVEGRLQLVEVKSGVEYYNDTNATTPEATITSITALKNKGIVLICGGVDKNLEYQDLTQAINQHIKSLILLPGGATEKIKDKLTIVYKEVSSMQEAVLIASEAADIGDVVLMSPAAASFGLFKNEYDRGDQFVDSVHKL